MHSKRDGFRKLFEELPIGVVEVTRDNRIRYANPVFQKFVGYDVDELDGMSLLALTDYYDRTILEDSLNELYRGETHYFEMETRYRRKDGHQVWGNPVRMIYPNPEGEREDTVLIFVVDITERKELEIGMRQREELNALGMLAGSIAHDFNNLLTIIKSYSGLAEMQLEEPDELKMSIAKIEGAADRGVELTKQLLSFGRQESMEVKRVYLNDAIRPMAVMFERVLSKDVKIELNLAKRSPEAIVNETHLHQVLMNLILNAQDAMERKGTLTIETAEISEGDPDFPTRDRPIKTDLAVLRICDDGEGVDPEVLPHIFDPFFTTKGKNGTGLGLTTVYGIVKEDKGYINVKTRPGKGTCFEIFLPVASGD